MFISGFMSPCLCCCYRDVLVLSREVICAFFACWMHSHQGWFSRLFRIQRACICDSVACADHLAMVVQHVDCFRHCACYKAQSRCLISECYTTVPSGSGSASLVKCVSVVSSCRAPFRDRWLCHGASAPMMMTLRPFILTVGRSSIENLA